MIRPHTLRLHVYDVGFGDCFLLSFRYLDRDRHVLIDFGSMSVPSGKGQEKNYMTRIAQQIAVDCGGHLEAVVATHRHRDHISGFASAKSGPGAVIRGLKPKVVVQPWTEDPKLATKATGPSSSAGRASLHVETLRNMNRMAEFAFRDVEQFAHSGLRNRHSLDQIRVIGMDNIANRPAIENLQSMAENHFAHFGSCSGLESLLPGVNITVLGPPTVDQTSTILKQRRTDPDEFWLGNAVYWDQQGFIAHGRNTSTARGLFPRFLQKEATLDARWFRYQARQERLESLLSIVRILDDAMNNTSLILLFEIGGKRFLFPGDAQYENWMFALTQKGVLRRLAGVDLYKVGHHGSLNATPKRLWEAFKHKGGKSAGRRLTTILSTKSHVHGHQERETEVPREPLVKELQRKSHLIDTRTFSSCDLRRFEDFAL